MYKLKCIMLGLFCISSMQVIAEEDPLRSYRVTTQVSLMLCQVQMKIELAGKVVEEADSYNTCVKENKETNGVLFKKAISGIEIESAKIALKNYHAAFISAISSLRPQMDERAYQYEERISKAKQDMDSSWSMLEVELL